VGRDPSEESGGRNLYAFCSNAAVNGCDYLGMWHEEVVGHVHTEQWVLKDPDVTTYGDNGNISDIADLITDDYDIYQWVPDPWDNDPVYDPSNNDSTYGNPGDSTNISTGSTPTNSGPVTNTGDGDLNGGDIGGGSGDGGAGQLGGGNGNSDGTGSDPVVVTPGGSGVTTGGAGDGSSPGGNSTGGGGNGVIPSTTPTANPSLRASSRRGEAYYRQEHIGAVLEDALAAADEKTFDTTKQLIHDVIYFPQNLADSAGALVGYGRNLFDSGTRGVTEADTISSIKALGTAEEWKRTAEYVISPKGIGDTIFAIDLGLALGLSDGAPDAAEKGLGANPFKGKTAAQIDEMFKAKGFEPRGPDPLNGKGGYVNPKTGRSYHIDEANSFGEPPHVDVNRAKTYDGPLDKKKYPFGN
jgi:hypothetical protein